jgi:cysteine desulfuration protein SufE
MSDTYLEKQSKLKEIFLKCTTPEAAYEKILELGRVQSQLNPEHKTADNLVTGCQSNMYLHSYMKDGHIIFETESDALISAGLGVLLTQVYSGEKPETILKFPPNYLKEVGLDTSLSPSRANGLYSLYLKMKQDALKFLVKHTSLQVQPQ